MATTKKQTNPVKKAVDDIRKKIKSGRYDSVQKAKNQGQKVPKGW